MNMNFEFSKEKGYVPAVYSVCYKFPAIQSIFWKKEMSVIIIA